MSCDRCSSPPLPAVEIEFDEVSASLSKCGYAKPSTSPIEYYSQVEDCSSSQKRTRTKARDEAGICQETEELSEDTACRCPSSGFSHDGKKWRKRTYTETNPDGVNVSIWGGSTRTNMPGTLNRVDTDTYVVEGGVCKVVYTGTVSTSVPSKTVPVPICDPDPVDVTLTYTCSSTRDAASGLWTGSSTITRSPSPPAGCPDWPTTTTTPWTNLGAAGCSWDNGGNLEWEYTYSEEILPISTTPEYSGLVTTESLVADVTAALGEFTGDWGASGGSFRNVSADESTATITKARWRLRHAPGFACYLKVWLRSVWTPEGGAPEYTDLSPYVWDIDGDPCLAVPSDSPSAATNEIFTTPVNIDIPSADGVSTVEIVKWSLIPDYTPGPGDPNGVPSA